MRKHMKSCQILSALSNGVKGMEERRGEERRGNEPSRKLSRTRFFTPSKNKKIQRSNTRKNREYEEEGEKKDGANGGTRTLTPCGTNT